MEFYDKTPQVVPRPKPMRVLVLGLPRTGTTTICAALQVLGIRSYHWHEILSNKNNGHFQLWLDALQAKYDGIGREFVGQDFDQMLWDYDAISCWSFVDELLAAYPDAKVVLTTRSRESWLRSMDKSVREVLRWRSFTLLALLDRDFTGPYWALLNRSQRIFSRGLPPYIDGALPAYAQSFDEHHEHVHRVVPADKLLEFHPSQGWKPLCTFLGEPVPDVPFPNLNAPESLLRIRGAMYWSRWRVVAEGAVKAVGIAGLVVGVAWWMTSTTRQMNSMLVG